MSDQLIELAEMCGVELRTPDGFEWQANVCDVALEVNEHNRWVHRVVVVVVSRQSGKTELLKFRILAGLYVFGDGLVVHTAQDRDLPRRTFEEIAAIIKGDDWLFSRVAPRGIRTANGQESIRLRDGSTYRIFAPREGKPVRGRSAGLLVFDEAREQTDRRLWTAALYTVRAHPNPQIWVASNAGDDTSIVLNDLRDRGRAAAEDPHSDERICYLEWSAKDRRPIDDRAGWVESMPGLGYMTDEPTVVEEMRSDDEAGFRTEALCQWVAGSMRHAVPVTAWDDCAGEMPNLEAGTLPVWFGVEIDPHRESGALAAVAWSGDRLVCQILERWDRPTEATMGERIGEWANEWLPEAIGLDPWTTNDEGGLAEYLDAYETRMISGRGWAVASSQIWELVTSRTILHGADETLDAEIEQAGRSDAGDGSWRITRKDSTGPIPGVLALTRAIALAGGPGLGEFGIVTAD